MSPATPLYGRREARSRQPWDDPAPYEGPTYYGRPALKPSHYKWLISAYLFVGGLAGASQVIATMADLFGREHDRGVVRGGRYLALLGSLFSPIFLIKDLQTPRRFYNMLRIFRPTSAMSIGSWTLAAFGTFSGLAALGQLLEDRTLSRQFAVRGTRRGQSEGALGWAGWLARLAGLPAAGAGAVMSCYTGSLLSSTSVPFWAVVAKVLPPLFGASAFSTGAAATSLAMEASGATKEAHHAMERVALAASVAEFGLAVATDLRWKFSGTGYPVKGQPKITAAYRLGALGLAVGVPLVVHAVHVFTGRRSPWAAKLADASALAGGFIQRSVLVFGGNLSAERPQDYFLVTSNGRTAA